MSSIQFQVVAVIGGVVTILIGLTLSDLILGAVANAGSYKTSIGEVRHIMDNPSGICNYYPSGNPIPNPSNDWLTPSPANNAKPIECNLSTFTGSETMLFLTPIIYFLSIITIGLGMIGLGAMGMAGRGPSAARK